NPDLRSDAILHMFKDAVAESVAADVMHRPAARQRRGGPKMAALFVAEVKSFSVGIAYWIVVPGCEAELMGIFAPGVSSPALRNNSPKMRVCDHIHPWRRSFLPLRGRNNV